MQGNIGFVAETGNQLLKGRMQRLLEERPTVLLDGLLSDREAPPVPPRSP